MANEVAQWLIVCSKHGKQVHNLPAGAPAPKCRIDPADELDKIRLLRRFSAPVDLHAEGDEPDELFDESAGWSVGSSYTDSSGSVWICLDNTVNDAQWAKISGGVDTIVISFGLAGAEGVGPRWRSLPPLIYDGRRRLGRLLTASAVVEISPGAVIELRLVRHDDDAVIAATAAPLEGDGDWQIVDLPVVEGFDYRMAPTLWRLELRGGGAAAVGHLQLRF
jgi:hypothetical protein